MGVRMIGNRSGFTFIELMIVVVIVAILTLAALPDGESALREEGQKAAERLEGDLTYARSLAIARPDDPVIIKIDDDTNRYWLATKAAPDAPIAHPQTGEPYVVQFGSDGDRGFRHVKITAWDLGGDQVLGFDACGGTDQQTPAIVQLRSGGVDYEIRVAPAGADTMITKGVITQLSEQNE